MQTNKIDKHIADKLKERELNPSSSAWERLNVQLDKKQHDKKKNRILYLGYAASIAMLISLGFLYQGGNNSEEFIEQIIVDTPLDTMKIKEIDFKDLIPVEEAIVELKEIKVEKKEIFKAVKKHSFQKRKESNKEVIASVTKQDVIEDVIKQKEAPIIKEEVFNSVAVNAKNKEGFTSKIKINSDALLYAVTHSSEEVKEYYAKYKIKRKDIINTIQKELNRSNLKINPETILAEVELDIEESDFQENFMDQLKVKLSDVIVAIADRNK